MTSTQSAAQAAETAQTEPAALPAPANSPEAYHAAAVEAHAKAEAVQGRLNATLDEIAHALGVEHAADPQKSVSSIQSRISRNVRDGKGDSAYTLKDLARGHLELGSWAQIPEVLHMLTEKNIPYTADVKSTDQGYRGLHILWNDGGVGIELQLSTPEAWRVKMQTEGIYAKWREADLAKLTKEQHDAYRADVEKSMRLWDGVQLPDFSMLISSSSPRGEAVSSSFPSTGRGGSTNSPSTSSSSQPGNTSWSMRNTRPDSVRTNLGMGTPPFNGESTIAQGESNVKSSGETTSEDVKPGDLPPGQGAASKGFTTPTRGEQVQTQNRVVTDSTYMTDEEKAALTPGTHEQESREMRTERAAGQFYNDPEGNIIHLEETVRGLLEKEIWTSADQEAAIAAQEVLINQARLAETPEARAQAWAKVQELAEAIERLGGTEVGRSLRARQDWIASSERIVSDAAMILQDARRGTDDAEILNWISEEAASWQRASDERDVDALRRIIERTSKRRRTGKLFSNELGKGISWALDRVCEQAKAQLAGGIAPEDSEAFSFLRQHAASGLTAVAYDQAPIRPGQALKTIRTNAMLSKISTIMRNLVSNNVFDPMDSVSRNISVPLDMALSKITGTRSVAADRGWLSGEKRQGSLDGLARSMLEVGLDVDATGERSRWETGGRRTFRMDAGPVQRALSTWEKWMGYMLNSTDQFQKGGIEAEVQRGLNELYRKGLITDPSLEKGGATEALYRTFQDETTLSKLSIGARRALNALHLGSVGLGDIALPFAQVPANLASRAAEYSPVGIAKGVAELAQALSAAHEGTLTAQQQAQAVQSIGRGLNGTALIAAAVALALKGVLKVHDNGRDGEDKDKRALEKASGLNGTQLNLSALLRWVNGESTEWRQGDLLHTIGFLDPLNAMLTTGSLIADDIRGGWDDLKPQDIPLDALEGTLQSVLDMPVMSVFKDVAENYRYSQADTEGGRLLDAAKGFAAGQVSSVIPNSIKGVAQAIDPYQRDAYTSQDPFLQAWDSVRMSVPGLRQTLPEKLDSYGEPLRQQDPLIRALNANVLPGAFQRIDIPQQAVTEELHSVYGKTGEAGVYPDKKAPNSVTSGGEKYELTADEKRQYQKTEGDAFLAAMQRLMASPYYGKWDAEEKADAITDAAAYGRALARQELIEGRGGSYEISGEARTFEKALTAAYAGVEIGRYYEIKAEHDRIGDTEGLSAQSKATRFALYLNSLPLTETQRDALKGLLTYSGGFTAQASDKAIVANDLGIEPDVYEGYRSEIGALHDVKNEDGKTTKSRKEQVVAYIDGLDLTPEQKDYLFQTEYTKGIEETPWHQAKPASAAWWLG